MDTNTTRKRDFLLGLVFFGTIGMLLYYTVILTGFSLGEKTYLEVAFPEASGLKTGDVVLVSGHQFGSVASVDFRDDQPDGRRIHVAMEFDHPVTLHRGYQIQISE
ncbi:MAG: MlaD family protein, partial [Planctomycetota bacterium]|nr:MlaD family protein [Planctomycetota bacterium]